ncbi:MAG TPA: acyl carrier protein [Armatimonadetes bacterium]|nr:acyl carrier protein [Armatimonadota bacterium]
MTREEVLEKVRDIVCEILKVEREKVTEDATFADDLNADSLDQVELVMKFEEEFGIEVPEGDAEKIRTVGEAVDYILKKKGTGS